VLYHDQHESIRIAFKKDLENTLQSIGAFKEMSQPVSPENAIGRISRMDAIQNKSVVESALCKAEENWKH